MEFARSQLQKHGWSEGKGLGRHEAGMKDAIKVKLKFDTAGVGHNVADQFTFHWWSHAFDKAANNINIDESEDGVKVNMESTGPLKAGKPLTKSMAAKELLYGRFVKSATLENGMEEDISSDSNSNSSDEEEPDDKFKQVTDEALFQICEGRTAHKGARHGLTASAKLSRVEEQEAAFLAKWATPDELEALKCKKKVINKSDPEGEGEKTKKKLKKKKKNKKNKEVPEEDETPSSGYSSDANNRVEQLPEDATSKKKHKKKKDKKKEMEVKEEESPECREEEPTKKKKKKKKHINEGENAEDTGTEKVNALDSEPAASKKKKSKNKNKDSVDYNTDQTNETKPKKNRKRDCDNNSQNELETSESDPPRKKKKKKSKH